MSQSSESPPDHRVRGEALESWKAIAEYFQRGVRTVRRWEREEGLPVHRHVHKQRATVYAIRSELDAWRGARSSSAGSFRRLRASSRVMIAVLPFADLSGSPDREYVAEGLTDEMIGHLGRWDPRTLGVIARTTMMYYRGVNRPVRQIGDELQVDYLVEGSVRWEADRVRVSAHLIDVRNETPLWSGTYEETVRSILVLQRELAGTIGREIRLKLSLEPKSAPAETRTVNPEAYYAHLQGRHFLNAFTPESVRRSLDCLRRAIEADPTYAPSYASLAEAYQQSHIWADEHSARTLPLALEAANQALRLEPDLPEAHASMGLISANYLWDWAGAERHFQMALSLNPGCSPARHWYSEFLAEMGHIDAGLDTIERAQRHDPLSRSIQATRAFVLLLGGRFDEAIAQAEAVLEIDRDYPMALMRLGIALTAKGRHDAAVQALRRAHKADPDLLDALSLLAYAQARAGDTGEALKQRDRLRRLGKRRYVPPFLFANICIGLGEHDQAIDFMEAEYGSRSWYLLLINRSPQFEPLRPHARFQALLRKMNFPAGRS